MGASDISFEINKKATEKEVLDSFNRQRDRDSDENGHQQGYSGDFQTVDTVKCHFDKVFTSYNEAFDYCLEKAEKWCYAVAVHYIDIQAKKTKQEDKLQEKISQLATSLRELSFMNKQEGFTKCSGCGSKLANKHLRTKNCLVCGITLFTKSELKKKDKLNSKINELKGKLDAIRKVAQEKAVKKAKSKNVKTLVAGWGAH